MAENYAYTDRAGILHINSKELAERDSGNGKIEPTDHPAFQGYPTDKHYPETIATEHNLFPYPKYEVRSLVEAKAISDELGDLYALVM